MFKKIFLALVLVLLIGGALAGIKYLQIAKMIDQGKAFVMPPAVVSAANATTDVWETSLSAIGSVSAVQGVIVTAETPGKIVRINFKSGDTVAAGDVLVQQDVAPEQAQLRSLEASANLTRVTLRRIKALQAQGVTSQSELDSSVAQHAELLAQIDALKATIAKKTIRAPFAGTLGIRQVDLGQNLGDSTPVVSLQQLDSVYVDFVLPQQDVGRVATGQVVRVRSDALGGRSLEGRLHVVEPEADPATRTVRMQALLENPDHVLRPGMFVTANVVLPDREDVIILPATAVLYAPYSDSIFVIEPGNATGVNGTQPLVLRQQFVKLGQRRGDFVAVSGGVKPGETVVSTGVFKYRNGQSVVIDNTLAPDFQIAPKPENS